jgi:hypothetical protein
MAAGSFLEQPQDRGHDVGLSHRFGTGNRENQVVYILFISPRFFSYHPSGYYIEKK